MQATAFGAGPLTADFVLSDQQRQLSPAAMAQWLPTPDSTPAYHLPIAKHPVRAPLSPLSDQQLLGRIHVTRQVHAKRIPRMKG